MKNPHDREYFEDLYTHSLDPWDYETSAYERDKYERQIEVLATRRYHRALEAGCSIGVFTTMLASLCDELLAVDISEQAVVTARERLAKVPHVCVERRTLPAEMPEGPFDLIVASEILYYLPRGHILTMLQRFEEILAPDGGLLIVNGRWGRISWRRKVVERVRPLSLRDWILNRRLPVKAGDEIHELLLEHTRLTNTVSLSEPRYRLDFFENK